MSTLAYTLSQKMAYRDTCDIIQEQQPPPVDPSTGKPGAFTFSVLYRNVPYHHQSTPNFPEATDAGQPVETNIMTTDRAFFHSELVIPSASLLRRTTPGRVSGRLYRVLSTDQTQPGLGVFTVQESIYDVREDPQASKYDLPA